VIFCRQVLLAESIEPLHYALGATIAISAKRSSYRRFAGSSIARRRFLLGKFVVEQATRSSSISLVTLFGRKTFNDFWHPR